MDNYPQDDSRRVGGLGEEKARRRAERQRVHRAVRAREQQGRHAGGASGGASAVSAVPSGPERERGKGVGDEGERDAGGSRRRRVHEAARGERLADREGVAVVRGEGAVRDRGRGGRAHEGAGGDGGDGGGEGRRIAIE
eukprot:31517-Pelagococcus_subviridis.AAC.3